MRKSREFDNILDECLERMLVRGETLEQCLDSFPKQADALRPLLEMAQVTRQAAAIQPRPEFRDRARYQFQAALQDVERKKSRPFIWSWQPRWAAVVAAILAFVVAGSGTVAAASGSMPDEPLYPVKLATEQVQMVLTPSVLGKVELQAKLADKRVLEITQMASESKPKQVELTARRLDDHLTKITVLSAAMVVEREVAMAPVAGEPPAPGEAPLTEEAPATAGEPVRGESPTLDKAPVTIEEPVRDKAQISEKAPVPVPSKSAVTGEGKAQVRIDRRARLKAIVARNAVANSSRLRALLGKVPEQARPALLRAIAISESGYEKALESLD